MHQCLSLGDAAGAQQQLHVAVVARAIDDRAATQLVDATVADVGPVGARSLHEANRAGSAGPRFRGQAQTEADDGLVRAADRQVQESVRVEQRSAGVPEFLDHRTNRDFRGARPVGVAAHAVDDDEKCGSVAHGDCHAILVFLAITKNAHVRVLDLQG
jgi:hypothetical protein